MNKVLHTTQLSDRFKYTIEKNNLFSKQHHLLVACSGGLDSLVLVNLLKSLDYTFSILHCNFQLRGQESLRDEEFVRSLAHGMGVQFQFIRFDTAETMKLWGKGVQETARILRYNWFEEQIEVFRKNGDHPLLLTAHHQDDQIETVAFNFFRGTGIHGLTGMKFKEGDIVRPLLFALRADIEHYAIQHQLTWVEDSSNKETKYARNQFRHEVFPALEKVLPQFKQNLIENVKRFNEVENLYHQQIELIKKKMLEKNGDAYAIPINKLMAAEPLDTIVYEIFTDFGFAASQVEEIKKMFTADSGSYIQSSSHRVLKNRNWLLIDQLQEIPSNIYIIENAESEISINKLNIQVSLKSNTSPIPSNQDEAWLDADKIRFPLIVRPWKQGDYFYPLGMNKKKKISKFLIDQKLSKFEKEDQYIIESDKKIIWVIGRRIDERFKVSSKTMKTIRIKIK